MPSSPPAEAEEEGTMAPGEEWGEEWGKKVVDPAALVAPGAFSSLLMTGALVFVAEVFKGLEDEEEEESIDSRTIIIMASSE